MRSDTLTLLQRYKMALSSEIITGEQEFVSRSTMTKYEAATAAAHRELVAHIEQLEAIAAAASIVIETFEGPEPALGVALINLGEACKDLV